MSNYLDKVLEEDIDIEEIYEGKSSTLDDRQRRAARRKTNKKAKAYENRPVRELTKVSALFYKFQNRIFLEHIY